MERGRGGGTQRGVLFNFTAFMKIIYKFLLLLLLLSIFA